MSDEKSTSQAPLGGIRIVPHSTAHPVSQEEAEAKLHREGYESFCWYDVPGATYPPHRHEYDECLWILRGVLELEIDGQTHSLRTGDRIYLPARTPHTARVPSEAGVTYLVGQAKGPKARLEPRTRP